MFAELCGRSNFSFLEGASHPEEMILQAKELGLDAIAIADRDGIYGAARAHGEAKRVDQKYIVGAEITLEQPPTQAHAVVDRALLLVEDSDGYANLCHLLTRAHADQEKGVAAIRMEEIAERARGLTLILADLHARPEGERAEDGFFERVAAFSGRAAIAVHRHLDGADERRARDAEALSTRYGVPIVATARPRFHHVSRKPLADVLHCVRHKTTLPEAGRALAANAEGRLRSAAEMARLFRDRPAWLRATLPIAERCAFSLAELRYRFPSDGLTLDGESEDDALRRLSYEGVKVRYPPSSFPNGPPAHVLAQLEKELVLIAKLKVAPYFLSVHQVVEMARARRILCQGRGSAANSVVCFVLGITAVDPARSNLLFERFLSAERAEPPDIDVDFEHERREEVIQDLYHRYGRHRAAMVSEIIAYRGKSAIREVGKAFGLSLDQVDRLAQIMMRSGLGDVLPARIAEMGLDPNDPTLHQVVTLAKALEGFPRHLSIHVGGFVLSADSLDHVAPVEPARMVDRTVVPWDKDDLDALGFFKIDVLALGMLTAIRKCLHLLHHLDRLPWSRAVTAFDPLEAFAGIPPEDPSVYEAIGHADTVGVFQIESRAQMSMLPRLKPRSFYDLVIEVAIVRPGPIQGGMVHPYLRRRSGKEPAISPHPCLDPILERTLGVPLFQEQVMQIAMVGAGYSAGEADQLRRDMAAWKKHGRLERHRERLLRGFEERGISRHFGEQLYKQIQGFGEYGFPESHAASFALLVYASAWLKTHHPAAFACALLNSQPMGFYSPSSIVKDAQRHGVAVRPVCVVTSGWDHSLEDDGAALRLGLRLVSGFGEAAGKAIEAERAASPLRSVMDLVTRANLQQNEIDALAEAGALRALVPHRRDALWEARAPRLGGLFENVELEGAASEPRGPLSSPRKRAKRFKDLAPVEQLLLDYGRLGLSIDDHPMVHVRPHIPAHGRRLVKHAELAKLAHGSAVRVAGLVIGRQRPATASGVTFMTLEDETGIANLIVTVPVFEAHRHAALHAKLLLVEGKLEREGEVIHVLASTLSRLELPTGAALPARSRDFH
ncbi:MAG: error-prone DNA polymerase [Polyangiaceae bacterium]